MPLVARGRGVSEVAVAALLVLVVVVAMSIVYMYFSSYTSRQAAELSSSMTSEMRMSGARVSIAYAYTVYETSTGLLTLHVFLAVSGYPVKLQALYLNGVPLSIETVNVTTPSGQLVSSQPSLPLDLGPGVYHLAFRGYAPLNLTGQLTVLVRLVFDVGIYDYEAPLSAE